MANKKITDLNSLTSEDLNTADVFPIVDVDTDETKKIVIGDVQSFINQGSFSGTSTGLAGTPSIAVTNITASGGISASSDIKGNLYYSANLPMAGYDSELSSMQFGNVLSPTALNGQTISITNDITASSFKIWTSEYQLNKPDGSGALPVLKYGTGEDAPVVVGDINGSVETQINGGRVYIGDYNDPTSPIQPRLFISASVSSNSGFTGPLLDNNKGIKILTTNSDEGNIHVTSSQNFAVVTGQGVNISSNQNVDISSTSGNISLTPQPEGGNLNLNAGLLSGDVNMTAQFGKLKGIAANTHISSSTEFYLRKTGTGEELAKNNQIKGNDNGLFIDGMNNSDIYITGSQRIRLRNNTPEEEGTIQSTIEIGNDGGITIHAPTNRAIIISGSSDVRFTDLPSVEPSVTGGLWISGSTDSGPGTFASKFVCIFQP